MKAAVVFCALLALVVASARAEPLPAAGSVEVAFTPWDDAEGALLRAVAAAKKTIYVQSFIFTSRTLGRALIAAHQRGVAVLVLTDREMLAKGDNSQIPRLVEAGIPVWLEVRYQSAHNKIMLIDPEEPHPIVVTGSYNFTFSAQARNAENLLLLRDNPRLAQIYLANWRRHHGEALAYEVGEAR